MLAGDGQSLQDDLAPEMSRIRYTVKARMVKAPATGTKSSDAVEKGVRVRVVPAREEDPPLNISEDTKDYELRRTKDIKKGLLKGKLGCIIAEAPQPSGFRLPALKDRSGCSISTITTVNLRFDPVSEKDQPPPLESIVSKLRVQTFFGSLPFLSLATRSSVHAWDTQRGYYIRTVDLSSRCISSVEWLKHDGQASPMDPALRRESNNSEQSSASIPNVPEPSPSYQPGASFYTAKVLVPMSLPKNKSFAPTFHSCSVSRTYVLDLNISYHAPGTNVSTPSIHLKLPIQISAQGNPRTVSAISEEEAEAIARREVDEELAEGRYSRRGTAATPMVEAPEYSERQSSALLAPAQPAAITRPPSPGPPSYSRLAWNGTQLRGGGDDSPQSLSALGSPPPPGLPVSVGCE